MFLSRDGESGNILDNLLKRMEQYANNLEVSDAKNAGVQLHTGI